MYRVRHRVFPGADFGWQVWTCRKGQADSKSKPCWVSPSRLIPSGFCNPKYSSTTCKTTVHGNCNLSGVTLVTKFKAHCSNRSFMLSRKTRREVRSDGSSSEYVADDSECNSRDTDQHQLEIKAPKAATVSPRRATPTDSQKRKRSNFE